MPKPMYFIVLSLICISTQGIISNAENEILPKPGECGRVNQAYLEDNNAIAHADEFPWIAKVFASSQANDGAVRSWWELAVLISNRYALASASEFGEYRVFSTYTEIYIVLGNLTINADFKECKNNSGSCPPGVLAYDIEDIGLHPKYNYTDDNNIAILRLARDVTFTDTIQPICLPTPSESTTNYLGQLLYYGSCIFSRGVFTKLKVIQQVLESDKCRQRKYRSQPLLELPGNALCTRCCANCNNETFGQGAALMGVNSICPNAKYFYLIGIGSRSPNVSIRVDSYMKWIIENIY